MIEFNKLSNIKPNDLILDVKDFNLYHNISTYQATNLRELFIEAVHSPFDFLFKSQDKILILDHVSFSLKKNEKIAFIGNNGCGKTSLCRYISGVYGPMVNIHIHGKIKSIYDTEVAVLPELSGRENLTILAHLFFSDLSKNERLNIVKEAIEFSEIGKFADVQYKLYSKGMRARVCLSLISARPADLLILDEVFNGADHFFSEKISVRVENLINQSGAVIFVSHSHDLIKKVCNRALVIHNKKIEFDGTPTSAIDYYRDNCQQNKIENA